MLYERKKIMTPTEVWLYLLEERPWKKQDGKKELFPGVRVQCYSLRLLTFKKSLTCVVCGITGSFFALERKSADTTPDPHLNLYAVKDGVEVLMTKDHIIPKSKGGKDTLENLQTMCTHCNNIKGNTHDN